MCMRELHVEGPAGATEEEVTVAQWMCVAPRSTKNVRCACRLSHWFVLPRRAYAGTANRPRCVHYRRDLGASRPLWLFPRYAAIAEEGGRTTRASVGLARWPAADFRPALRRGLAPSTGRHKTLRVLSCVCVCMDEVRVLQWAFSAPQCGSHLRR